MPRGQDVPRPSPDRREWLLTDGAGGSALGTASGVPQRRTHAVLHATGDSGPITLLLGFDERLLIERETFVLFADPADPSQEPASAGEIESFEAIPWPSWRVRCGEAVLEKSLFMLDGHHALALTWRHVQGPGGRLRLGPLIVARPPGALQRATPEMRGVGRGIPGRVHLETLEGQPGLTLWHGGTFLPIRQWRRSIRYSLDPAARPTPVEDAFIPGYIDCALAPGEVLHVVAATDETLFRTLAVEGRLGTPPPATLSECVRQLEQRETTRQSQLSSACRRGAEETARQAAIARGREPSPAQARNDVWIERWSRSLGRGVASRAGRITLLDGFPLASETATRTLRALPAWIALRAFDLTRSVLRGYVDYLDDGLVPAGFGPDGRPLEGDPIASLWLVSVAERLARRSEDVDWAQRVMPSLESILHFFRNGSAHGPRVDRDGLLAIRVGEGIEKPALLNILWYHAMVAMAALARFTGRREAAAFYLAWARQHGQSFNDTFWDEAAGCLHPVVGEEGPRAGFGRDQLFALTLTPSILPSERAAALLERVESDLDPPWGRRPEPAAGWIETEWIPLFYSALLRVRGREPAMFDRVRAGLSALESRLESQAMDDVPEWIADDPSLGVRSRVPAPGPGPAVSMVAAAELLRLWIEDVERPAEVELSGAAPAL